MGEILFDPWEPCGSKYCGCPMAEHDAVAVNPYVTVFLCRAGCSCPEPTPRDLYRGRYICGVATDNPKIGWN